MPISEAAYIKYACILPVQKLDTSYPFAYTGDIKTKDDRPRSKFAIAF
ncbi:MAG: hypothetical protein KME60_24090 [Cyanomargarita calcarea GSE-NOS-MK-12-04C]|uniref:Uncharacterized protein n=1 Tax=Cyanomargarita calcarea GSE-NOS-MK-12-04C TaxID=2839659 RepID=A0A951UUU1_9CYAN|nr:hypothetical protein [Cyanomargarita calcarea GSE-NOS-MK-12-04C]